MNDWISEIDGDKYIESTIPRQKSDPEKWGLELAFFPGPTFNL
jgi:hypothetical protein